MDHASLSLVILGAVIVLFVWDRLPAEIIAVGTALTLYFTGLLGIGEALAGFGDPVPAPAHPSVPALSRWPWPA